MTHKPDAKTKSRRERRIERRKQEIIDAAARIFAEKGYANATTKEIADAADMAEGTLYNYFGGKRELLLSIAGQMQTTMRVILQDIDQIEKREEMIALIEKAYTDLATKLPFIRAFWTEAWVDDDILQNYAAQHLQRIAAQIQTFIARRIDAGVLAPVDPACAASMVIGMFTAPILPALRGAQDFPAPQERRALAETMIALLLNGIPNPPRAPERAE